jgi:hypothetical protein
MKRMLESIVPDWEKGKMEANYYAEMRPQTNMTFAVYLLLLIISSDVLHIAQNKSYKD